jgi:hypothetical protein
VGVLLNSGNGNFTGQVYTIDTVAPYVQSINRAVPNPTNAGTVHFTVTFSEPVTGVDPTDFQLTATGAVGTTLTQVTPVSASVYTVTVSGISGNGTLGLNLVDNGSIHDLAGNPLTQANAPASFQNQVTFAAGPGVRSLAAGDVNGDGIPDLVVGIRFSNYASVMLGNGNGTFQAAQSIPGSTGYVAVALADVNGDGKPDLLILNNNGVGVLLGNGDGTFQAQQNFAAGSSPISVAVRDINGDQKLDVVVANQFSNNVSVLLGNGDGTFQAQKTFATGPYPKSVALGDVNGDGIPDVVVASYSTAAVSVLLGNGDGTFQAAHTFSTGSFADAVALGDVNGDGRLDIAVANNQNSTVSVLLGNGDGTFQTQNTYVTDSFPSSILIGDVNGDGKPDVVTTNAGRDSVSILLGNGDGTFQTQQTLAAGFNPFSMALVDLNGDGRPDLAVANNGTFYVSILLNAANGNFTGQVFSIDHTAPVVQSINRANPVGQLTNASTVSFAVTFSEPVTGVDPTDFQVVTTGTVGSTMTQVSPSGPASVYTVTVSGIIGSGTLGLNLVDDGSIRDMAGNPLATPSSPARFKSQTTFATGISPFSLTVADLNGDGVADVAAPSYSRYNVSVLLGNSDGNFQTQHTFTTGSGPRSVAVGDFNGDGKRDLAVANGDGPTISVLLGNGDGSFQNQTQFVTAGIPFWVAAADVNGDGKVDLVTANNTSPGSVSVLLGNGDGTFQSQMSFAVGSAPRFVAVADVSSDGKADLVVANNGSNTVSVLLGNGNGTFQGQHTFNTGAAPLSVAVADVSGDGIPDLVIANSGGNSLTVLMGNGNATFQAPIVVAVGASPRSVEVHDLNGDGFPDLITANYGDNNLSVVLGNGNGTFQSQTTFGAGRGACGVVVADANGDGRPDLLVANRYDNTIGVLLGSGNGNFTGQVYTIVNNVHFSVSSPSAITAGTPFPFIVTAMDPGNNTITGYIGTVQFTSTDPQLVLFAPTATLTNGAGIFAATLKTAGGQSIVATDSTTSSITGSSGTIAVSPAAATHFREIFTLPSFPGVASGPTSFAVTGQALAMTVIAYDAFDNFVSGYNGTVAFSSSDSSATLPPATPLSGGQGVFSVTLATAGSQTIMASDGVIAGASSGITTRGLVVTGFTATPTGFTISFDKPFSPATVAMYTQTGVQDDIMLATAGSQVSVRGSVVFNSPTNPTSITFIKTTPIAALGTFNPGPTNSGGLLTAGNYTVTLRSFNSGTSNGFADVLGKALDGTNSAGGTNFKITFSVSPPPVAVGIPDFARGPSNTDAIFVPSTIGNGGTFNLIYTNPNTLSTGTATVTFSTASATLQSNIQTALNALPQIGLTSGAPNGVVAVLNDIATVGANFLVTFQNGLVTATSQVLASTTAGATAGPVTINVSNVIPNNGIPVALSSGLGVTSGSFSLEYNPSLLTIQGGVSKITGASFTVNTIMHNATSATAMLSLSSPSSISSTTTAITIGSLLATVPFSATASYGAKQILHFSAMQLNGTAGSIPVTNQDAVQVAAFFGDVIDNGQPFSLADVNSITTTANIGPNGAQQTLPGFPKFACLDPVIIGDVALQNLGGIVSTDASSMNQQLTIAKGAIPFLPAGLAIVPQGPDPTLMVDGGQWTVDGSALVVPVTIDTARPLGSTGMTDAILALSYDPRAFTVSTSDIRLGTVPEAGGGWQLKAEVNAQTGLIGVELFSNTPIQSTVGGSLVTISLHALSEPRASASTGTGMTPLTIVPIADPTSGPRVYRTTVSDAQGAFVLDMVNGGRWTMDGEAKTDGVVADAIAPRLSGPDQATDIGLRTPDNEIAATALSAAIVERVFGDTLPLVANWQPTFDNCQSVGAREPSGDLALFAKLLEAGQASWLDDDHKFVDPLQTDAEDVNESSSLASLMGEPRSHQ